ncbi:hypothetical protein B9Z19DRAFT_1120502 [Tuber borchii]|uniref:Uncharacterized protein n=1 Tax=Tuber borchii TaxID=42251 RepID=A0A2T7A4C7_TUBBO|nr:hypothetical protein B9Z19DRAFT_1120502 [Tuber borchii]
MPAVPADNVGEHRTPSPPAQPFGYPPSGQMLGLSPPSSLGSAHLSPQPSAPHDMNYYLTEGLKGVKHQQYGDRQALIRAIDSQVKKLRSGEAGQYPVFAPVTQNQLAEIERIRHTHHKGIRFHYFYREKILIVKIFAGPFQAVAGKGFGSLLDVKIAGMGLLNDICRMDAATYEGNGSEKQAEIAWKPCSSRPLGTGWPTVVIECGVSQSHDRLEVDANWWFENSGGQVKTVFLISFSQEKKKIHLEQWELVTVPDSHLSPGQPRATKTTPTMMRKFDLVEGVKNRESLMLNFERVFLRPPAQGKGQREGDITFSRHELELYANHVWAHTQKTQKLQRKIKK